MKEQEAIKRIKECRNTPNFQPYIYMNEALDMAIKALEKQIPKKKDSYSCPVCSNYFEDGEDFNYCPECGQRWE